ncbi:ABC transporter ATP-binding protein [Mesoplasma chauliocola]|uniref:ABC transporter ATP-binding protein n=1 Tax=Mesoplasma chauliocola TaxID=216427 RepID=A0A249SN02_9MOLU|nr:ABC transporter ATP-binding protein [Mesoplasma chauliocola]ASZ08998.1 ABC transporter ATP-binding protein [Mesoplasma chauliocola]
MKELIKINKIKKENILQEINLSILENECVSIMGNSGVGKTTLLNILSGIEKPSEGSIIINGTNIVDLKEPKLTKFRSNEISYIYQDYKLIEYLTVEQNIKFIERNNKNKISEQKYKSLLNELGLVTKEKVIVAKLSGGQKQRVAIARALLGKSKIILADEPTGALDLINTKKVLDELIVNSKKMKKTLVIVTHSPQVGLETEKIVLMNNGKITEQIKTNEISINELEKKLLFENA